MERLKDWVILELRHPNNRGRIKNMENIIIGIDIGNTHTVIGLYNSKNIAPYHTLRIPTRKDATTEEIGFILQGISSKELDKNVEAVVLSSVVPALNSKYKEATETILLKEFFNIDYEKKLNIQINYDNPKELGVDRIVNACAALHLYNDNLIIVDIGTAATFCVQLKNGTYKGGLIAPGIGTTIKALSANASQLPEINFKKQANIICTNTKEALNAGFYFGWLAMVKGVIEQIKASYPTNFQVVLTGGFAKTLYEDIDKDTLFEPNLTMKGIKFIYDLNKK